MRLKVFASAAAVLALAGSASAATITKVISFTASDFGNNQPFPQPTNVVQGSVTLTFDPSQTYLNDTADITLNSLNIDLGSAISFSTDILGELIIGGVGQGADQATAGHNDFQLAFSPGFLALPPVSSRFSYVTATSPFAYFARNVQVTVSDPSAAPEPSTWAILLAGMAAVGASLRFRKRQAPALDVAAG